MKKIPRFATEYKNHLIRDIANNDLMRLDIKQKKLELIDKYYFSLQWDYISINEYMNGLSTLI